MNRTCPRCSAVIETNSRFCTSCGALSEAQSQSSAQQGWSQGSQVQGMGQVPPWASANQGGTIYQQQGQGTVQGGLFGLSQDNEVVVKRAITVIIGLLIGTLVLLVIFGLLAALIPGLRCVFLIVIALVILLPWIIYVRIRSYIRRTVGTIGRLGWFL